MNHAPKIAQEFHPSGDGRHRLVSSHGPRTAWAAYTQFTYLSGVVGVTDYYQRGGGIMPPEEFCLRNGVRGVVPPLAGIAEEGDVE